MPIKEVDTIVVGAGQAGIAMSEHLTANGIDHLIFERDRIAESWRTRRWDSLEQLGAVSDVVRVAGVLRARHSTNADHPRV